MSACDPRSWRIYSHFGRAADGFVQAANGPATLRDTCIYPPKSVTVSNSRVGSGWWYGGQHDGTNQRWWLPTALSDYSKLKNEPIRATGTSRTDSIWGILDWNWAPGVEKGRRFHVPRRRGLRRRFSGVSSNRAGRAAREVEEDELSSCLLDMNR